MSYLDKTIKAGRKGLQGFVDAIYPPTCLVCDARVEGDRALCGKCWGETPFISGLCCDKCGVALPGVSDDVEICDDCRVLARPWVQGRAALAYEGTARKMILALKHADKTELVPQLARWMARSGRDIIAHCDLIVPVPAHWTRTLQRQYDQAELLAVALGKITTLPVATDALIRTRKTGTQDGKSRDARFANTEGAFRTRTDLSGKTVLLVDDVMTSGASFAAAADACTGAGANDIYVLAAARVAKEQ
ncbi:MAG: ComF family protein [Deltaproteobacteria bacterium]